MIYFGSAKIIIAQHGAALANLIFAKPNTMVLEIVPKDHQIYFSYFSELAKILGLRYRVSIQKHSHANVDINDVISKLF